jgi:hypothetical protein
MVAHDVAMPVLLSRSNQTGERPMVNWHVVADCRRLLILAAMR